MIFYFLMLCISEPKLHAGSMFVYHTFQSKIHLPRIALMPAGGIVAGSGSDFWGPWCERTNCKTLPERYHVDAPWSVISSDCEIFLAPFRDSMVPGLTQLLVWLCCVMFSFSQSCPTTRLYFFSFFHSGWEHFEHEMLDIRGLNATFVKWYGVKSWVFLVTHCGVVIQTGTKVW